jgi:hypothetical protein
MPSLLIRFPASVVTEARIADVDDLNQLVVDGGTRSYSVVGEPVVGAQLVQASSAQASSGVGAPTLSQLIEPAPTEAPAALDGPSGVLQRVEPGGTAAPGLPGEPVLSQKIEADPTVAPAVIGLLEVTQEILADGLAVVAWVPAPELTYAQTIQPLSASPVARVGAPGVDIAYALEGLHNAIRTAFNDLMNGGHGAVPIIYDNELEEPPSSGRWVRFAVLDSFAEHTRFGGEIHRRQYGEAVASIYTPIGEGNGDALEIINDIKGIFKDDTVDGVVFQQPSVETRGVEQRWWRIDLICPYYFDDTPPAPTHAQSEGLPLTEEYHNVIREHFKEVFADVQSVPVQYDNAHFDPPNSGPWVRLSILGGATSRTAAERYRTSGIVDAAIFTPVGAGDQQALSLADRVANAFMPSTVHGVKFRLPSVSSVGSSGRYWQVTVTCPFVVNEV